MVLRSKHIGIPTIKLDLVPGPPSAPGMGFDVNTTTEKFSDFGPDPYSYPEEDKDHCIHHCEHRVCLFLRQKLEPPDSCKCPDSGGGEDATSPPLTPEIIEKAFPLLTRIPMLNFKTPITIHYDSLAILRYLQFHHPTSSSGGKVVDPHFYHQLDSYFLNSMTGSATVGVSMEKRVKTLETLIQELILDMTFTFFFFLGENNAFRVDRGKFLFSNGEFAEHMVPLTEAYADGYEWCPMWNSWVEVVVKTLRLLFWRNRELKKMTV